MAGVDDQRDGAVLQLRHQRVDLVVENDVGPVAVGRSDIDSGKRLVEPVLLVAVDPVQAIGDILGREETGDVRLSLDPGVQLKNGDVFTITVESGSDGHLMLFDVNQEGKATQIFPNEAAQKITPLTAHAPLTIPDAYYGFDFEADGAGESVLVAIVVADPLDLSKLAPASQGLTEELDARLTIADIVGALKKTWTEDTENRGIRWSLGTLKYTIY